MASNTRVWLCSSAAAIGLVLIACNELTGTVEELGFRRIAPPSTLPQTGTIVAIRSVNPLRVSRVCSPAEALGPGFKPDTSRTAEIEKKNKTRFSAKLSGVEVGQLQAAIGGAYVREAQVTLTNAHIQDVTDVAMAEALKTFTPAACVERVRDRLAAKQTLTMLSGNLTADATYTITYTADVDATTAIRLTDQIQPALGAGFHREGSNTLKGQGLVWGVSDDTYLFRMYTSKSCTECPQAALVAKTSRGGVRRLLPQGTTVILEDETGR